MKQLSKVYVPVPYIIKAYKSGLSYNRVARKLGCSSSHIKKIMREHAPEAIRTLEQQLKVRRQPPVNELTLDALGLRRIGPCLSCGVEIVSTGYGREVCGLCKAAA